MKVDLRKPSLVLVCVLSSVAISRASTVGTATIVLFGPWSGLVPTGDPASAQRGRITEILINGRHVDPTKSEQPQRVRVAINALDTVEVKVGAQSVSVRARLVAGQTYTLRSNPCSGIEMFAYPEPEHQTNRCRLAVRGEGSKDVLLTGCGAEITTAELGASKTSWTEVGGSAMCPYAPEFITARRADREQMVAHAAFQFLHDESVTVIYDSAMRRFDFSLQPADRPAGQP